LLQMLEPDEEVTFDVGTDAEDRNCVAKAALLNGDILDRLTIHSVTLVPKANVLRAEVNLWQERDDLYDTGWHFDEVYKKIEDE